MALLGRRTIRQKLTSISVLSSITALGSSSLAFLAYDAYTFRAGMTRRLLTEAQILGLNSVSPLAFDDVDFATATLRALQAEPAVTAAVILRQKDGAALASYARPGADAAALLSGPPLRSGHLFTASHLLLAEPLLFEGKRIGTLLIQAELGELRDRQRRYAGIVALVLAGSFLLALAISRLVEETISSPILQLAETARAVSAGKDYSVRARSSAGGEMGLLVTTFNEMLDQIQRQDSELKEARSDLEERVEARTRDLALANKELEAFSYSVSHDLRAPLRAIDGFSKALLSDFSPKLDERGRHYLERVRAGTQRMSQLIDDMLGLARVSRRELQRETVSLSELSTQVAAELARRDPERKVQVDVQQGLTVEADPHLLTIALENLLGNAWKFTSRRSAPHIEVGHVLNGAAATFYVRDNGAGFDMAYADKLFGAFQRLHGDSDFEGTGIGLATVHRIVSRHGGRIWAEGTPGQGATFYFTLERNA